jgi:hypothetical protein
MYGDAITISTVDHSNENADLASAGPLIGGGAIKVASIVAYDRTRRTSSSAPRLTSAVHARRAIRIA